MGGGEVAAPSMEQVDAAVNFVNRVPRTAKEERDLGLTAFMALFHPDWSAVEVDKMVRESK